MYLLVCSITSIESLAGFRVLFDCVGARGVFSSINETFSPLRRLAPRTAPRGQARARRGRSGTADIWMNCMRTPQEAETWTRVGIEGLYKDPSAPPTPLRAHRSRYGPGNALRAAPIPVFLPGLDASGSSLHALLWSNLGSLTALCARPRGCRVGRGARRT